MAMPSAQTVADRWANAAGAAQQRFTEGVQTTSKDPTALAAAQQGALLANFNSAVSSGLWARRLQAVGKAGWQSKTLAKAANYSTGIAAAKGDYLNAIGPVLNAIDSIVASLPPRGSLSENLNRANQLATGLYNWKRSR